MSKTETGIANGDYYPFDFGSWRAREKPLICPRHGAQDGGLSLHVIPSVGEPVITRNYCGMCIIEALDRAVTSFD